MIGKTYGGYTVIGIAPSYKYKNTSRRMYSCKCLCGKIVNKPARAIRINKEGCIDCARTRKRAYNSPAYESWKNMRQRVSGNHSSRGKYIEISICEEWADSVVFTMWAEANGYKPGYVLHRKDNKGDYCPENCVFLSKSEHIKLHKGGA